MSATDRWWSVTHRAIKSYIYNYLVALNFWKHSVPGDRYECRNSTNVRGNKLHVTMYWDTVHLVWLWQPYLSRVRVLVVILIGLALYIAFYIRDRKMKSNTHELFRTTGTQCYKRMRGAYE